MQGLTNLKVRLRALGGNQEGRLQKDKLKSMQKALLYSYQGANIEFNNNFYRGLINPNKLKQDYDDKILSIEYSAGIKCGDVFYWSDTNTYWLVYLENLEEDSYFRGEIRRCRYDICFLLDGKKYSTKAAIRGPVETKIVHNLKSNLNYDTPNYTLNLLLPATAENLEFFKRYNRFMLKGVCWEVQTADTVSMDGVIEITAKEHYIDDYKDSDTLVNEKLPPELLISSEEDEVNNIKGESLLQYYEQFTYIDTTQQKGTWTLSKDNLVKIISQDDFSIVLEGSKAGTFSLIRTVDGVKRERQLRVDSLF